MRAHILNVHARATADRGRDDEAARWAGEALTIARELNLAGRRDRRHTAAGQARRASRRSAAGRNRDRESHRGGRRGRRAAGRACAALYNLARLHYGQGRLPQAMEFYQRSASARLRDWAAMGAVRAGRQWFSARSRPTSAVTGRWHNSWSIVTGQSPPELADALFARRAGDRRRPR